MKEFERLSVNVRRSALAARTAALSAAAATLGGCVHPIAETRVDPASPIAPYVAEAARHNTGYPKFSDIPPKPTDVTPPAGFKARVNGMESARAELERQTAPQSWTLSNTQAFAKRAEREAGPDVAAQKTTAQTEAFAASQRQRATPPPPPKD